MTTCSTTSPSIRKTPRICTFPLGASRTSRRATCSARTTVARTGKRCRHAWQVDSRDGHVSLRFRACWLRAHWMASIAPTTAAIAGSHVSCWPTERNQEHRIHRDRSRKIRTLYTPAPGIWPGRLADGGATWQHINKGMIDDSDVFSIIVDSTPTLDRFCQRVLGNLQERERGRAVPKIQGIPFSARRTRVLKQDPTNANIVYAGTTEGLWKTDGSGENLEAGQQSGSRGQ